MPNCIHFSFWWTSAKITAQSQEEWSILNSFGHLGSFFHDFWQVKHWLILNLTEMVRVSFFSWVSILFCTYFWPRPSGRNANVYEKRSVLSIFNKCGYLHWQFRQGRLWHTLNLPETDRSVSVDVWPIIYIIFCNWSQQKEMLKLKKHVHPEVLSAFVVCFPTILGSSGRN